MSAPQGDTPGVSLPAGWTIGSWRETSQSVNGQILQGIVFTLNAPMGGATSVFVPYSVLHNKEAVRALMVQRIASIANITA